jgi:hypothetical protein
MRHNKVDQKYSIKTYTYEIFYATPYRRGGIDARRLQRVHDVRLVRAFEKSQQQSVVDRVVQVSHRGAGESRSTGWREV